jgi:hypothetical protein
VEVFKVELARVLGGGGRVAQIWWDDHLFAELRQEASEVRVHVHPPAEAREWWDLSYDALLAALTQARVVLGNKV